MSGYVLRRFLADRRKESVVLVSTTVNRVNASSTNLDVLSETRGVVVSSCLGVTEGFEYGIGSKNLALYLARLVERDFGLGFDLCCGRIDGSEITHNVLGLEGNKQPS